MAIIRIIAACLFITLCHAQNDTLRFKYEEFDDKLSVQLFTLNTSNSFSLHYGAENLTVDVEPNKKTTLGISVQYDIVFISLGFAPSFFADNKDNANSKMVSFALDVFPGRFVQHFDYYYQRGISLKSDNVNLYLENLKTMKIGGSTAFVFNRQFSYRAIALQNGKQTISAGTFAPTLSYYYTELNGKSQEGFGDKDHFVDVALSPTYYYNWVIAKNFMVSAGLGVGAGITLSDESSPRALYQASAIIGLGYNAERFFAGINSKGLASSHNASEDVAMDDSISYATAFVGYRFDAPKFLVKGKEKIKERIK
ncbi:DUF4421 family protein [Flavobacterium sp. DGU11]|uniref:DUF4421 family protein n=1 Tax=Flavobacterium arundinis TaxID=3139143 RepID=A0ABU9I0K2_9FLAO